MPQTRTKRKATPRSKARRAKKNPLLESIAGGLAAGTAVVGAKALLDKAKKEKNPRWVRTLGGTVGRVIEIQGRYGSRRHLLELQTGKRVWVHGRVYDVSPPKVFKNKNPNGASAAAKGFEDFHGRSATEVITMQEAALKGGAYFALGNDPELWLVSVKGSEPDTWPRPTIMFEKRDGVKLVADRAGKQLYFTGNTAIGKSDLKKLGDDTGKRFVPLGTAHAISYTTDKHFDGFKTKTYAHEFGEETGEKPILIYDQDFKALLLVGGAYSIAEKDLSLNASPGIVN